MHDERARPGHFGKGTQGRGCSPHTRVEHLRVKVLKTFPLTRERSLRDSR
ncbi:hypothetical protein AB0M68_32425 [Streptomyces sp. NPDC051453]